MAPFLRAFLRFQKLPMVLVASSSHSRSASSEISSTVLKNLTAFGRGLPMELARGLAIFLNSTLIDQYFRQFNGHTQVNATDLRNIRYPTREQLIRLGRGVKTVPVDQAKLDTLLETTLYV
jgi:hypothetical protein